MPTNPFKVGDKVKLKGQGYPALEVLAVRGQSLWVLAAGGAPYTTHDAGSYEKVPDVPVVGEKWVWKYAALGSAPLYTIREVTLLGYVVYDAGNYVPRARTLESFTAMFDRVST